jgi:hypothetical protein
MKELKVFIRFTMILWVLVVLAGCGTFNKFMDTQIVGDLQVKALAEPAVKDLARHVIKNHPEDIQKYIRYCNLILTCDDKDQQESYLNIGIDTLIDRNVDNIYLSAILTSLKGSFDAKVNEHINFDMGEMRTALNLVRIFKDTLEDGII